MTDEPMEDGFVRQFLLKTSQLTLALDFDPRKDKNYIIQTKRFVFSLYKIKAFTTCGPCGNWVFQVGAIEKKKAVVSSKPIGVGPPSPVSWDQISFPPGSKTDQVPSFHFLFENEKHLFSECLSDFLLLLVAYGTFWSWWRGGPLWPD